MCIKGNLKGLTTRFQWYTIKYIMRNDTKTKIGRIMALAEKLPYFTLADLLPVEKNKNYLKILLSRRENSGKIIRLKKGVYVAERYLLEHLDRAEMGFYYEFLANILYRPSYLSMEYVLYENNLLTEMPKNFISVTKNKTISFSNKFGHFFYHKIKDNLYGGFETIKKGDFTVFKATKVKALFDFLYLRKNLLVNKESADALRLNLNNFSSPNRRELLKYVSREKSKKMKEIFHWLFE